ncbi:MAG TPA: SIMPL domain-containing protein [Gaiellaceae bacterium]|nr:SIMPL domain-containing protein [Gaiellaceae bacterium]
MKIASIAAVAALLVAAAALAGVGRPPAAHSAGSTETHTITVDGRGTARGVPDTAVFSLGVESSGATARAASAANADHMRRVIEALVGAGVARSDLQTQDVSVYPRENGSGNVIGFTASGSVSATVKDIARAGKAVDAAVAAGANQVSGPQFERSSRAELYRQALRDAFSNARAKAEALAEEAGAQLGQVHRINENDSESVPVYPIALRAAESTPATPVEPGTQEVDANVTVTFELA